MVGPRVCFRAIATPPKETTLNRTTPNRRLVGGLIAAAAALLALPGIAAAKDRNDDGIPDRWEKRHHLSLKHDQAGRDQDRDGLRNAGEFRARFDPRDDDSDDDGIGDGDEGAGTIASFDATSGVLVIDLFNGDSVSGTVTDDTEIECRNDDADDPDEDEDDHGGPGHQRLRHDGDDDDADEDEDCSVADLTAGTVVHEAELEATADGLIYEEIEL